MSKKIKEAYKIELMDHIPDEENAIPFYGSIDSETQKQVKEFAFRYGLRIGSLYGTLVKIAFSHITEEG